MIYCVEDESAIRDLTVYTLKASGFEAMGFENSTGFWAAMKEQRPELIILGQHRTKRSFGNCRFMI